MIGVSPNRDHMMHLGLCELNYVPVNRAKLMMVSNMKIAASAIITVPMMPSVARP